MKIAAILGTDGGVSFAAEGFHHALARIGQNTGNALFQRAVWDLIPGPKFNVQVGLSDPIEVSRHANVLVIPAANQINPNFNLDAWTDFIEKANLPCVVIGLGAQCDDPNAAPEDFVLTDSVVRFAKTISAKSQFIGVRGKYTKAVLESINVTNTVITGCPSQTINKNLSGNNIERLIRTASSAPYFKLALLGGTLQEYTRETERKLYRLAQEYKDHKVVYQTQSEVLKFIHNRTISAHSNEFFNFMRAVIRPDLNDDKFFHYLGTKGVLFSDARSWIDAMAYIDLAIGMRIHGAVAAIQAGRLGVCVAFDSRTLELAETMEVPYVLPSDVIESESIASLIDRIHFDPVRFDQKRKQNIEAINLVLGSHFPV